MAAIIVCIELASFAIINIGLNVSYLIATPVSMGIGIVLNWYFSQKLVFKNRKYKPHIEFTLVLIASLVGVAIQLVVTAFVVEILHMLPILGKVLAIIVTFFWNFWIRKKYIFAE